MPEDDGWTGSLRKPWLNPPHTNELGARRGPWALEIGVIAVAVVAAIVVLALVSADKLDRGWAYAVLPIAIFAAASAGVLTVLKAASESKRNL